MVAKKRPEPHRLPRVGPHRLFRVIPPAQPEPVQRHLCKHTISWLGGGPRKRQGGGQSAEGGGGGEGRRRQGRQGRDAARAGRLRTRCHQMGGCANHPAEDRPTLLLPVPALRRGLHELRPLDPRRPLRLLVPEHAHGDHAARRVRAARHGGPADLREHRERAGRVALSAGPVPQQPVQGGLLQRRAPPPEGSPSRAGRESRGWQGSDPAGAGALQWLQRAEAVQRAHVARVHPALLPRVDPGLLDHRAAAAPRLRPCGRV